MILRCVNSQFGDQEHTALVDYTRARNWDNKVQSIRKPIQDESNGATATSPERRVNLSGWDRPPSLLQSPPATFGKAQYRMCLRAALTQDFDALEIPTAGSTSRNWGEASRCHWRSKIKSKIDGPDIDNMLHRGRYVTLLLKKTYDCTLPPTFVLVVKSSRYQRVPAALATPGSRRLGRSARRGCRLAA